MSARLRLWNNDTSSSLNLSGAPVPENGDVATLEETSLPSAPELASTRVVERDQSPLLVEEPHPPSPPATSGLHEILKSTDFWFALEVGQLEKYAQMSATEHAKAGLPRLEASSNEELESEQVLRARACELFLEWTMKVRRKVQDSIQAASVNAGTGLVQLRGAYDQLLLTTNNIRETERQLREAKSTTVGGQKTVEYGGLMRAWPYWAMFVALSLVDWIANVPVFGQLLPKDPGAQARLDQAVADAGRHAYWGGTLIQVQRVLSTPDISLLALGVVIFLMFLCHACGKNLRRVVAFRRQDEPLAELGLKSHRRQSWIPFGITAAAIVLAVSFLFLSRSMLEPVTAARFSSSSAKVQQAEAEQAAATAKRDADSIQASSDKLDRAQKEKATTQADHDYAEGISGMNFPIGLLNIVLVLTATTASYLHDKGSISEVAFGDPRVNGLHNKLVSLRAEAVLQRGRLRDLDSFIQRAIAQANYLAQSLPLREWPAKARRLEAVIPLFRAENAQQRGIDVGNIKAFEIERPLNLSASREDEAFQVPTELRVWESEFVSLRKELDRLQAETAVSASVEV